MSHKHSKSETCLNCGYEFKDENNYCPSCGQQNHSLHVPFKHLVLEFLEGTIHLDTKIVQTFKYLVFKPGYLTREFNTGKRATYVPPVRIYIFVSFVFFLLIGLLAGHNPETKIKLVKGGAEAKEEESSKLVQIGPSGEGKMSQQQLDSLMSSKKVKNSAVSSFIVKQVKKSNEIDPKEYQHTLVKNISYLMFFLMPLFAAYIMLFNLRKGYYYYEFLVYSIHLHSFLFLLFSFFLICLRIYESGYLVLAAFIISVVYFILSMKNAFPQKISSAVLKSVSLVVIYGISLSIFLIGTILVSVMLS